MGGRGSGSRLQTGRGRRKMKLEKTALDATGAEIDLSDTPLAYGDKDPNLSDAARKAIEAFEDKRVKAKIEFGLGTDSNGVPVEKELRGGSGSVKPTYKLYFDAEVFSHNHPRSKEPGCLGGTFSPGDMKQFASWQKIKTMRATTSEGTYSISKKAGFDARAFYSWFKSEESALRGTYEKAESDIKAKYLKDEIDYKAANAASNRAFNKYVVEIHNKLIEGSKTYNYYYTLERK